jgi:hypothetical protein
MNYSTVAILAVSTLIAGCAAFADPNEPLRRPYQGIDNFGPTRSIATLPKGNSGEVILGRLKHPNGEYLNADGTFEFKVGSRGECVYAFKVDTTTRRLLSWRLASKGDPAKCE